MKKKLVSILIILFVMLFVNCSALFGPKIPESFSKNAEGWADIPLNQSIEQDQILIKVQQIITRKNYEPEIISKDTGYLRTKWRYTVSKSDQVVDWYRTRITIQIAGDYSIISINCEAGYLDNNGFWVSGVDTAVLADIKDAIRGVVGEN